MSSQFEPQPENVSVKFLNGMLHPDHDSQMAGPLHAFTLVTTE
jgi:hypothetical protein